MFTGLIEGVGRLAARDMRGGDARLRIEVGTLQWGAGADVRMGESISVNGTCLTVVAFDGSGFEVALVPHTLAHTAFAKTKPGDAVNLEVDMLARYVERLLAAKESP